MSFASQSGAASGQPQCTVREATADDLQAATGLAARFYSEEGFATPATHIQGNLARLIAAETAQVLLACVADGSAVGLAVASVTLGLEHLQVAELQDLYVLPEHRRAGVAAALIAAVLEWADSRNCEVVDVVVDADGDARHGLVGFYVRHGFSDEHRRLLTRSLRSAVGA